MQQLTAPIDLPFEDLNAAAGYAVAAASFSVNPPASIVFNGNLAWSAAGVVSYCISSNDLWLIFH